LKVIGIIPARYASSRFPGKPLVEIDGKSMIRRVYEQVRKSSSLTEVIVATDDQRIVNHVKSFQGNVIMTSQNHNTGTERCNEVVEVLKNRGLVYDVAINIQGDEPFINPKQIDKVASCFKNNDVQIATLIKKIENIDELFSPNVVKVVISNSGKALYFSRQPIPYCRNSEKNNWLKSSVYYKHIGIYAYRNNVLNRISSLPTGKLETAECLEQLRWIENGFEIYTEVTAFESHSIDVPDDLLKVIKK